MYRDLLFAVIVSLLPLPFPYSYNSQCAAHTYQLYTIQVAVLSVFVTVVPWQYVLCPHLSCTVSNADFRVLTC